MRYEIEDFPPVDELPIYGVDEPTPTTIYELKCEYNEDERCPLVLPDDLEGYRIPPEGIVKVWANGVGARAGKGPMVYAPGTFRENKHTINKEFGITAAEANDIRTEKRKEALRANVIRAFEDNEIQISGRTPEELIGTLTYVVLDRALKDDTSLKELRLLRNDLAKTMTPEDDTPAQIKKDMLSEVGSKTIDMLDDYLKLVREMKEAKTIDGDIVDVTEGEWAE